MTRKTTEQFIEEAKKIHGDKYDYSLSNYINAKTKVKIICKEHGIFEQIPNCHINRKHGCPDCKYKLRTLSNEKFIEKSKIIHCNKYDYSLVNYKNNKTKVEIICKEHGIFKQKPNDHLNNHGCPYCVGLKRYTNNNFIKKSKEIHSNKYDYSLVNYKNARTKVKIICPKHGIFEQMPYSHLKGYGCVICGKDNLRLTNNDFIKKSKEIHDNKYDYSLINYNNNKTKIKIICPFHGVFNQEPQIHLNGGGCPVCNESKGEKQIRMILKNNNIKFQIQKTFKMCKFKYRLRFDFYLPDNNLCIEYDGRHHFEQCEYFGGYNGYKIQQKRDQIKNEYCKNNNINLLRIKYDENIEEKLFECLNSISKPFG